MKTKNMISYIGLALILIFSISGCREKDADIYGQTIQNRTVTEIDTILKESANFDGKTVTVQGKIIRECPTGCWFEVKENSGVIYVDINPSGFAIPQKVGKKVVVEGKVKLQGTQPILTGTGVEIK